MNKQEKKAFIRDLTKSVNGTLLSQVERMPDEWDGHELRQLLADVFARQVIGNVMKGRRLREYRNVVITRNL